MPSLLSPADITTRLADLPGWSAKEGCLEKTFTFPSFADGMVFLNEVAQVAEDMNHHPDIDLRFSTLRVMLSTHSAGGVTEKDITLARAIEGVKNAIEGDTAE